MTGARVIRRQIDSGLLEAETVCERIEAYLNIIGRYMTDYSDDLGLEHKGSQLRLDVKNLTAVATPSTGGCRCR